MYVIEMEAQGRGWFGWWDRPLMGNAVPVQVSDPTNARVFRTATAAVLVASRIPAAFDPTVVKLEGKFHDFGNAEAR